MFGLFRRGSSLKSSKVPRPSLRPPLQVEILEDRCVPTTVMNTGDVAGDPNSLRGAILNTPAGGTVDFASGVTGTIQLTTTAGGQITIDKNLTITGAGASAISVQAAPNSRIFSLNGGGTPTVSISGLTLTGSNVTGAGGAINNANANLNLVNSVVSGNTATVGGGIYNLSAGQVNIISMRTASATAAASLPASVASAVGNGSADLNNPGGGGAGLGGAIFNFGGTLTVTNSTFFGNAAIGGSGGNNGGGLAGSQGGSGFGGAILNLNGSVTLTNVTLDGDSAVAGAGGSTGGPNGSAEGADIYNLAYGDINPFSGAASTASVSLTNTILASGGSIHGLDN